MNFSEEIISQLRSHTITYENANFPQDRKKARQKMQKLGFRMTDFNLRNITSSDFENLIAKKSLKISSDTSSATLAIKKTKQVQYDSPTLSNLIDAHYQTVNRLLINSLEYNGLYILRLKEKSILPQPFQLISSEREHQIIYVGKSEEQTLRGRLGQELYAKGHGTFFRSIGAVLGYLPESGSLYGKSNQNNYKFRKEDAAEIILWIENNLEIAAFKIQNFEIEKHLICKLKPLLNDSHNPLALRELRMAQDKCRTTARNK